MSTSSNYVLENSDFYQSILNSIVYFARNIKNDITLPELEKLLLYKESSTPTEYKDNILNHFNISSTEFDNINKYQLAKIFEYLSALELSIIYHKDIIPYDLLSIDFKDSIVMPTSDIGLDLISLDKTYTGQCKHYLKNSYISTPSMQRSDYCCLRILRNTNIKLFLEFITPADIKFSKKFIDFTPNHKILTVDTLKKWLYKLPLLNDNIIGFKEDINTTYDNFVWRDCQKAAINHIFNRVFDNDKNTYDDDNIYVNMVCGSGKSDIVAGFINYYLKNYKILILVPRLLLLEQFTKVLDYWGLEYNCVGTDYDQIIDKNICLCVYNSIDKVKDLEWNCMIIDEAHHIEKRIEKYIENDSDSDSDDDENSKYLDTIAKLTNNIRTIFFSASLKRCDFNYDLRSAINDDVLVDYQLHIPIYYNDTFENNVVKYIIQNPVYSSLIAFCNTINDCIKYKDLLLQSNITCDYIASTHTKTERTNIMNNFKNGKIRVLLSVRILCEGINIPSCNSVMFIDERYSEIEVLQCMLRCTRKYKDKKLAHIILPPTYKDEINNKMMKVIIKIAKGDSKLYNILKEGKKSNQIKINYIKNDDDDDYIDNDCTDIYDIIYDSSMKIIMSTDIIERLKKQILLFKEFHNIHSRFIAQKEKYELNGYTIRGSRLDEIKQKYIKNANENDEIIIFIKDNYIELYNWYIEINKKEPKQIIRYHRPDNIKDEILLYKKYYDLHKEFIKFNDYDKINNYNIDGKRFSTIKNKLRNLEKNNDLILFVQNNFVELYDNINKEVVKRPDVFDDEILLYKNFYDTYGRFIYKSESCTINDYEIDGYRLKRIKIKLKNMPATNKSLIFVKNNFIELYNNINEIKNNEKIEYHRPDKLEDEILLYKKLYVLTGRFMKDKEKDQLDGYDVDCNRYKYIKLKLSKLDENDTLIEFVKNNFIELYNNITTNKNKNVKVCNRPLDIENEILLYKKYHDLFGYFIMKKDTYKMGEYDISGIRLSIIKRTLKKLEENDKLLIFVKDNYIELYENISSIKNNKKIYIRPDSIENEIVLYKKYHDLFGHFIKKGDSFNIDGYDIDGNRLDTIKQTYLKNLQMDDKLMLFIKNNYIELYDWCLEIRNKNTDINKKEKRIIVRPKNIKDEILLYKKYHDLHKHFIKNREQYKLDNYDIDGLRLYNIKVLLKKLDKNDELILFVKDNYIELYNDIYKSK